MERDIDIRSFLGLIRRQAWVISLVSAAALLVAVMSVYSIEPRYTATAKVIVDLSAKNLLVSARQDVSSITDVNARVESEVEILQSDQVLIKVIKDHKLVADEEFGVSIARSNLIQESGGLAHNWLQPNDLQFAQTLQKVRNATSIARRDLTYVIGISFTSKDSQKAARLANALAMAYIEQQVQSKISRTVVSRNIIQGQLAQASAKTVTTERDFDAYVTNNVERLYGGAMSPEIARLQSEITKLKRERDLRSEQIRMAQLDLSNGDLATLSSIWQINELKILETKRRELSNSLNAAAKDSKQLANLKVELGKIDNDIRLRAQAEIDKLTRENSVVDERARTLRNDLRKLVLASDLPPKVLADIYSLQQDATIARNQYQALLIRLRELDTKSQLEMADSRVASIALAPPFPTTPNRRRLLFLSLICAAGLGAMAAVFRDHFVGGFTNEGQVEPVLRLPLATAIPKQNNSEHVGKRAVADLVITSPLSVFSESIRRIRVTIERFAKEKSLHTNTQDRSDCLIVLVSSSEPNEGKSTVALSLARTLAGSGKKTLLIDGDLRRPSINKLIGIDGSSWLSELLRGEQAPQGLSRQTVADPLSDLALITVNKVTDIATDELVMGERFANVIAAAKRHFDYILIDSPPVIPVVDALYLARYADIVVFVVRWASTSQSQARKAIASLLESTPECTPITVVLNQTEPSSP